MENFADWLYRTRMRKGKFTSQLSLAGRYQLSGYHGCTGEDCELFQALPFFGLKLKIKYYTYHDYSCCHTNKNKLCY